MKQGNVRATYRQSLSVITLTAWLSVCLLALGWNPNLAPRLKQIWLLSGLTGIVSSFGLAHTMKRQIAEANERLTRTLRAAKQDPLTNLLNRRGLTSVIEEIQEEHVGNNWFVIVVDIDDFKHINDQYGHDAGDDVICAVAHMLSVDSIAARFGGDEFVLLYSCETEKQVQKFAESFRQQIAELPIETGTDKLRVSVSIGIAQVKHGKVKDALTRADEALYKSKRHGKNQSSVAVL